jgi:opacity protein-like surface antigen
MNLKRRGAVVVSLLLLSSSAARADSADGAVAIGSTVAIGAFAGIACWAMQSEPSEEHGESDAGTAGSESAGIPSTNEFARRGWFAGLQGIYAKGDYAEAEEAALQQALVPFAIRVDAGDGEDSGWGVGGNVGNRCHSRLATEAEVQWMTGFTGDVLAEGQGRISRFFLDVLVGTVNFKAYLLTGRFQPYGLVGIGAMTIDSRIDDVVGNAGSRSTSNTMFAARFGGGIDVYVTKHIVAKAGVDYLMPISGIRNFEAIIVDAGLEYRF